MKKGFASVLLTSLLWLPQAHGENLMQVYNLAVQNDATLKAARANRDSVRESKPQARAALLPNISMNADANNVNTKVLQSATGGSKNVRGTSSLGLSLSVPVYRRDLWVRLEQADDQIAQSEAQYAAAEQDLIIRTAQAYFDILSAQDSLEFAKAETAAIARQLDQAKQRFDVGLIAITAVHEAQAAYDQSRSDLILAENELDNAWEALFEITRKKVNSLSTLADDLALSKPKPQSIEAWSNRAQQQNLSIRAAQEARDIARKNIKVQQSGHYPTLDLVGSHDRDRTTSSTGTESNSTVIGLQFNLPLYTGGGVTSRTKQARFDLEAAQENLDRERRSINRQVRDAYRRVLASISAVQALKASTISTRSALEATEAGFEVGTRTMVDVLNAQRDLYQSLSNYATVRYNYIMSGLRLKQAAGTVSADDLRRITVWLK